MLAASKQYCHLLVEFMFHQIKKQMRRGTCFGTILTMQFVKRVEKTVQR